MKAAVTGANGFVGRAVCARLAAAGHTVVPLTRHSTGMAGEHIVGDLAAMSDLSGALAGVDVVVHAAARVHVLNDGAADPLADYRAINVDGSLHLARGALTAGVRRFVFISSIKVNGEEAHADAPFTAQDPPSPTDPYGISKQEAEEALFAIARNTAMDVVAIRPVLVFGPGVGANFRALMSLVRLGLPLPLGAVRNRRSMIYLDNLADLIARAAAHHAAGGRVFLAADRPALSTADLLRSVGQAMNRSTRLLPVPILLLQAVARLFGYSSAIGRVTGSLVVDDAETRRILEWSPPIDLATALRVTVEDFLARRGNG